MEKLQILLQVTTEIFIKKNDDKTEKERFFSNYQQLDTNTAEQVYKLFIEKSIFQIPPQDSISNWDSGCDGITYIIEHSTKNSYSFKEYWTPSIFIEKVDEAKRLQELIDQIEKLLDLQQSFKQLIISLPSGAYDIGGGRIIRWVKE